MERFEGTVRLPGDPFELPAVLQIINGRLTVSANAQELGDWALDDISALLRPDGCHVLVDGEELIVSVPHPVRLADAIGTGWTDPRDDLLSKMPFATKSFAGIEAPSPSTFTTRVRSLLGRVPLSGKLVAVVLLLAAILWVFLPIALVGLLIVAGTGLLLAGTVAALDPFTAVELPDRLTAKRLIGVGVAVVAAALVLAVAIA